MTLAGQRGRFVLVTFVYTHCPDVCPLITQNLNSALRQLGSARKQVRVLAVSVDPKGDTAAAVRRYAAQRELLPEFRYLIGSRAALRRTWAAWHVLAVQRNPELVDHVAYTALIDRTGKQRVLYDSQVKARQVLHDLRVLMRTTRLAPARLKSALPAPQLKKRANRAVMALEGAVPETEAGLAVQAG